MKARSRLKMHSDRDLDPGIFSRWMGHEDPLKDTLRVVNEGQSGPSIENKPIEPEGKKLTRPSIIKWVVFLFLITYLLLAYFRGPILTRLGSFLVITHEPKKAELIVCLRGKQVELGLAAADLYKKALAPQIFVAREDLPDGYTTLEGEKVHYPESRDLLVMMLQGLGVPRSAIFTSERFVGSPFEEAREVRKVCLEKGYRSLIIVTSPPHSKLAWLIFKKIFEKDAVKIIVIPSQYTGFKPDNWWKTEKYVEDVMVEYQKLLYYSVKYLW